MWFICFPELACLTQYVMQHIHPHGGSAYFCFYFFYLPSSPDEHNNLLKMQTVLQVNKSCSVINVLQHTHIFTVSLNLPRMLVTQPGYDIWTRNEKLPQWKSFSATSASSSLPQKTNKQKYIQVCGHTINILFSWNIWSLVALVQN